MAGGEGTGDGGADGAGAGAGEAGRAREVRADRHMSDLEALMWNLDRDPFLSSTFGSLTVFDRPPDMGLFRERVLGAVAAIPQLRRRVVPVMGRLAPPEWQDDPDFDIDRHLRRIDLPAPGDERALLDLAAAIVAEPLDRDRPLWEFTVVEGLDGGRAALVQKMHHTITDGVGGIRMSEQFVDLRREVPPRPPVVLDPPEGAGSGGGPGAVLRAAGDTVGHVVRRGLGLAAAGTGAAAGAVRHPDRLLHVGGEAVGTTRTIVSQLAADRSHSPLWTERTLRRRLDVLEVSFDDVRRAAKALGGSINDLFVAAVAGGVGAYHRRAGAPVAELRMAMPVSVRRDASAAGNAFVPTRVLVPTDIEDPVARFAAVHESLGRHRDERALDVVGSMAGLVNLVPTALVTRVARAQVETIDFTTSNLRAAPFELFIAGARIEATYALGPLAGTAFNVTMMSYDGSLQMGIHSDPGAIDDPEALRDDIATAFDELIAAGGP